jgi:hypothetical protein
MTDQSSNPSPAQTASFVAAKNNDRFTCGWLIAFCCCFLSVVYGDRGLNVSIFVPALFSTLLIGCCWVVFLVIHIARRRWQRLVSLLAAPFIAFTLVAVLIRAGVTSERIRLEMNRKSYEAEIARLPQTGEPRFHEFPWGSEGGFVTSPHISYTLVFDETDEIGLPPDERSVAWRERMTPKTCVKEQQCAVYESAGSKTVSVTNVTGHFFLLTEMSQ